MINKPQIKQFLMKVKQDMLNTDKYILLPSDNSVSFCIKKDKISHVDLAPYHDEVWYEETGKERRNTGLADKIILWMKVSGNEHLNDYIMENV